MPLPMGTLRLNTNYMRQPDMGYNSLPREFYIIPGDLYLPIWNFPANPVVNGLQFEFVLAASRKYKDPEYKISNQTGTNDLPDDTGSANNLHNQFSTLSLVFSGAFMVLGMIW